jgi:hypothetical protein
MKLRHSASTIAVIVDVLLGQLETSHGAAVLGVSPATLEKLLHEIREFQARRRGERGHLR